MAAAAAAAAAVAVVLVVVVVVVVIVVVVVVIVVIVVGIVLLFLVVVVVVVVVVAAAAVAVVAEVAVQARSGYEDLDGVCRYSSMLSLNTELDWVGWPSPAPADLPPGTRCGTHCTGGWVGPRASMDGCGKPGFDPRTVQSVVSHYTDCV